MNGKNDFNKVKEAIGFGLIVLGLMFTFTLLFMLQASHAQAADVTLAWDANDPAPEGYRVFYRPVGMKYDYTKPACQTKETTCTITGLVPGAFYYFVARAYVGTNESGDSNEVTHMVPIQPPAGLRIVMEVSVYIDVNGKPIVLSQQNATVLPAKE